MNIETVYKAMFKTAGIRSWLEGIFPETDRPLWVDRLLGNVLSAQEAADAQAKGLQELRNEWIRLGKPKVDWKGDAMSPRFSLRSNLKYVDPGEYVKNLLLPTIRSSSLREAADKALDSSPSPKIDLNPKTNGLYELIDTKP